MASIYNESLHSINKAPEADHIRLFQRCKISRKDRLTQAIWETKVFSLRRAPRYGALSYSWGTNPQDAAICLLSETGQDCLRITQDLDDALSRIEFFSRSDSWPEWWWIDQICINQGDDLEKADQVGRMKTIYGSADCVCVWLGTDPENDIQKLPRSLENTQLRSLSRSKMWSLIGQGNRVWWRRLWVIQEIALCPRVFVWIDWQSQAWEQFVEMFDREMSELALEEFAPYLARGEDDQVIYQRCDFKDAQKYLKSLNSMRAKLENSSDGLNLLDLLKWTSASGVTVAVDRIYSLLGICSEEYRQEIPVKYGVPRRIAYAAVVEHVVRRTGNLNVLFQGWHRGGGLRGRGGQGEDDSFQDDPLPTWMPNFSRPFRDPFCDQRSVEGSLTVGFKDGKELWLCAIPLDVVATCSVSGVYEDPASKPKVKYSMRNSGRMRFSNSSLYDRHDDSEDPFFDFGHRNRLSSRRHLGRNYGRNLARSSPSTNCFLLGFDTPFRPKGPQISMSFDTVRGLHGSFDGSIGGGEEIIFASGASAPYIVRLVDDFADSIDGESYYELIGECLIVGVEYDELRARANSGGPEAKTYRVI